MSSTICFRGGRLVLSDRIVDDRRLIVESGRIAAIEADQGRLPRSIQVIDLKNSLLTPGLVDIHVHGGGGGDFMDGTADAVRAACRTHLRHGTTTIFPTTTTGSPEQLRAMFAACREVMDHPGSDEARIAGIHLYGPYFAPDKVGCHALDGCRPPDPAEYRAYFDTRLVRIATCAAELPGATQFYRLAKRAGCLVTCGHSNSTYQEMAASFRAGLRHVDHFWCVMSSVDSLRARCGTPMQAGMEQFVLLEPEMSTEVIADGCHLSPELLNFAYRMKGPARLCLVTDASRAVDMPPGQYRFGPESDGSWFVSDGDVGRVPDGSALASSVAGMDRMVRNMHRATDAPLPDLFRMASLTPAERAGVDQDVGSIAIGKRGDLVVWSSRLQVRQVYQSGHLVPSSSKRQPRSTSSGVSPV
jgi:N-acetylglucosamine-6-phosphate deacetylase